MCGIALAAFSDISAEEHDELWKALCEAVESRGPDGKHSETLNGIKAYGSTLQMRGVLVKQPLIRNDKELFLFNGELFGGEPAVAENANDTETLFAFIDSKGTLDEAIVHAQGPFALVHCKGQQINYLRDRLGRRSLLHHLPTQECPVFFVTSVWPKTEFCSCQAAEVNSGALNTFDVEKWRSLSVKQLWKPHTVSVKGTQPSTDGLASLKGALLDAVRIRVMNLADKPITESVARVGILFSGGVDCATLAALGSSCLNNEEPIDLINVAFESPRVVRAHGKTGSIYDVPDRLTGRQSFAELQKISPNREWRFVEIDVSYDETLQLKPQIMSLMLPQQTVMDYSIGMALFFASRGKGVVKGSLYTSQAQILLSGLGADELFGGYSRHRRAFQSEQGDNWEALAAEMQLDLQRIGSRNMGRDDRCISVHGKEVRYPFLDENVIDCALSSDLRTKCNPVLPEGVGDKIVLRQIAKELGLVQASSLKKRAMQFGSRSAKRESGKVSGVDIES